jgi:TolA-binding protein
MLSSAIALSACASSSALGPESSSELMAELRALRADHARLEQRLDRLEKERAVSRAVSARPAEPNAASSSATPASTSAPHLAAGSEIPQLTVVKLKPRREAAAKIDTTVEVQEPGESALESLKSQLEAETRSRESDDVIDLAYEKALNSLKTGNVAGGVGSLMRIAADNPRHAKADNALYFAGLGQMGLTNFTEAEKLFGQVVDLYPAGDAVQDAMLKLAECRLKLNRPKEAKAVYEKVVTQFPGSAAASQAQSRLTRF